MNEEIVYVGIIRNEALGMDSMNIGIYSVMYLIFNFLGSSFIQNGYFLRI